ncbi:MULTISPECIES: hypothetical protein [Halorussus]|uniref:hypothetical protein n=1 Tax=Halorussus TaxID=1070314 RepID=UPI000E219871|nr:MULTISPECIES: hypothetical protein [Halorussus]NHN60126.1 hypothetical protein [Halorussus sp. JP-T4]
MSDSDTDSASTPDPAQFCDVFVRLRSDLLVIGDSIITDRHHASNNNYNDTDPQNQIGGIIPAFSLSGWLRHGMERVVHARGGSACHPGEANANFRKDGVYERDLKVGYHEKGDCLEDADTDGGCIVFELFGGFDNQPGTLMRRPIKFNPVRSKVEYPRGQAEGHYRRLNRNVVSRNPTDNREPLRNAEIDAVANLDGCWHLSFRDPKPEFLGLLVEAIEFLNDHQTDFMHQLGGARNFGAGIVDCGLITPLYENRELKRVFDRKADNTERMDEKTEEWNEEYRPAFVNALDDRIAEGRT